MVIMVTRGLAEWFRCEMRWRCLGTQDCLMVTPVWHTVDGLFHSSFKSTILSGQGFLTYFAIHNDGVLKLFVFTCWKLKCFPSLHTLGLINAKERVLSLINTSIINTPLYILLYLREEQLCLKRPKRWNIKLSLQGKLIVGFIWWFDKHKFPGVRTFFSCTITSFYASFTNWISNNKINPSVCNIWKTVQWSGWRALQQYWYTLHYLFSVTLTTVSYQVISEKLAHKHVGPLLGVVGKRAKGTKRNGHFHFTLPYLHAFSWYANLK